MAKNAVYGKWVGGGAEGEAQRQDSAQEILKTAQWKVATERKRVGGVVKVSRWFETKFKTKTK